MGTQLPAKQRVILDTRSPAERAQAQTLAEWQDEYTRAMDGDKIGLRRAGIPLPEADAAKKLVEDHGECPMAALKARQLAPASDSAPGPLPHHCGPLYRCHGFSIVHGHAICLDFMDMKTGESARAFINVCCEQQRGKNKGKRYSNPRQFWLKPGSKFRAFWISTVGDTDRWRDVWRSMGRLKTVTFTADPETARGSDGSTYTRLKNLRKLA